jgi:hypothetical protein
MRAFNCSSVSAVISRGGVPVSSGAAGAPKPDGAGVWKASRPARAVFERGAPSEVMATGR